MQVANGRVVVPAPAFTPSQYGLLSVAQDRTDEFNSNPNTSHWGAGIIWQPLCADGDTTFDECVSVTGVGLTPQPATKAATYTNVRQAALPFTVYVRKDCSIPTYYDQASGEVREALTEAEAFEVERAFWTGTADGQTVVYPHLAANAALVSDRDTLQMAATVVGSGATDIVTGFGQLELAAMACMRGQVTIHVPASAEAALMAWDQVTERGGRYYTALGNLVAIGAGYTGSSPAGVAATTTSTWIYATGPVFYARGPMQEIAPRESVVLSTNTLQQMAERTYIVGYSCCLLAVQIDLTLTVGGGGSVGANVNVTNFPASYPQPTTQRSTLNTLLTAGADRTIPAGRRSYAVVVSAMVTPGTSVTLDGVGVPAVGTYAYSAPNNDTLAAAQVNTTGAGDVVLVMELF